jgi:glycosyltransferase involved in cell wall biosynthesis
MRICFISRRFFPTISGMSVYAANLLRELVRLGHDVTMISQFRGDPLGTKVYGGGPPPPVPGVRVIGLESLGEQRGGDFEADIAAIVQTIEQEHAHRPFDLIHAQYGYPPGLAALEASRRLGLPNLVSIQGGDGHWVGLCCPTHKAAMLAVLGHAGALLIGSRSFAEEVRQNHGTPPERFTIIPGAVDPERFHPRDGWRPGALIEPGRPLLLYHGRVDRRKGALDLLDALALLREQGRAARLIVSGIGPDSDVVAQRVEELGLAELVELTGYAAYDDVPAIYRRADIFVSPTYAEGFSNTILEAMASGLPTVSTYAVGVVDCLRNDENGLLVTPGDVPALAEALGRMCADASLRTRLAQQAYDEAQTLYAWPTVARQIAAVYERLRGTAPDNAWTMPDEVAPCRYREQPHLL